MPTARVVRIPKANHYVFLSHEADVLREMDAFPATDTGLLRGAAVIGGARSTSATLLDRAESWRPWRAYAAQHLWAVDSQLISKTERAHG